jgi:hypothetical protein
MIDDNNRYCACKVLFPDDLLNKKSVITIMDGMRSIMTRYNLRKQTYFGGFVSYFDGKFAHNFRTQSKANEYQERFRMEL